MAGLTIGTRAHWIVVAVLAGVTLTCTATPVGAETAATSSAPPVLGVPHSFGTHSSGWGRVRPDHLYNGGDGSGDITLIKWSSWGGATARGHGKNSIFKQTGGYYRTPVTIRLRATDLGVCASTGQSAYRHLLYSEPSRPGGAFGPWRIWTSYHRNLCTRLEV
jgi:hypothetical protein